VSEGILPLFSGENKIAVFWEFPEDHNLLYKYTEVMTGEHSVSTFKPYTAVMTIFIISVQ
jgi:hypothetical protein